MAGGIQEKVLPPQLMRCYVLTERKAVLEEQSDIGNNKRLPQSNRVNKLIGDEKGGTHRHKTQTLSPWC